VSAPALGNDQPLDPAAASRLEELRFPLVPDARPITGEDVARLEDTDSVSGSPLSYVFPEHSFGLREGIDPIKLGQLAEDL
jgi:hypothetical protein